MENNAPWLDGIDKKPKSPREIIADALKALDAFSSSCPSGISLVQQYKRTKDGSSKYGSPHSTHYIMHQFLGQYSVSDAEPCCQVHRKAIEDLAKLPNWYWKWRAKRAINKKSIYFALTRYDNSLMKLLGFDGIDLQQLSYQYKYSIKCDYSKFNLPSTSNNSRT